MRKAGEKEKPPLKMYAQRMKIHKHRKLDGIQPNSFNKTLLPIIAHEHLKFLRKPYGHRTASWYAELMRKLCAQYATMKAVPLPPPGKRICILASRLY